MRPGQQLGAGGGHLPEDEKEKPVACLTIQPDEIIYDPFDFSAFITTAGSELAARVMSPENNVTELSIHLPGNKRAVREAKSSMPGQR